jgi:hypothetical protein
MAKIILKIVGKIIVGVYKKGFVVQCKPDLISFTSFCNRVSKGLSRGYR